MAFLYTTASPGTTGPALIFTSREETATGIGVPAETLGALDVVPVFGDAVVFPAAGKFVLPVGATVTVVEPVKK
jgi:hypothetical protein